jgi:hypothetical protein
MGRLAAAFAAFEGDETSAHGSRVGSQSEPINNANFVMAGLVPAIHVFSYNIFEDVDARHKAGHDGKL